MQRQDVVAFARAIAAKANGSVQIVYREEDESPNEEPEAGHFLKVEGKRLGRDIETYGFLGEEVKGWPFMLALLYEEILIPLKGMGRLEESRAGAEILLEKGLEVWPESFHPAWKLLFEGF